ncbi:MAG: RIP metalloprotease RseP [Candidatus Syntrophosphaera sp.]|nr:RIP metalloprotease RseP [Candidatus Syntrophosphaera sp.]
MTLILTILAFGLMIFIHELGHFLAARWFGVGIEKFSLGFGKPILQFEKKGIKYRIGWLPLGGYVKMKGENPDDPSAGADSFRKKAWWKKVLIAFSGPFANLILGLLLFMVSFVLPLKVEDQRPIIHRAEGKWAEIFVPGDSLISFNSKPIQGFSDFLEALLIDQGGTALVDRSGEPISIDVQASEAESLALSLYPQAATVIGDVIPKTPAYHANLRSGDLITAVDSVSVSDWYAMRELIVNSPRDQVVLDIRRGEETFSRTLNLETSLATGTAKTIGILQAQPVRYTRHFSLWEAVRLGSFNTANFISTNYQMLYKLVKRPADLQRSVGGPVMIATLSQQVGRKGLGQLLLFFGSISLILMIMNLLPIPILDGGMILFAVIEGIIRKPISVQVQSVLQTIGLFLLMALMFMAFYSDIASEVLRFMNR